MVMKMTPTKESTLLSLLMVIVMMMVMVMMVMVMMVMIVMLSPRTRIQASPCRLVLARCLLGQTATTLGEFSIYIQFTSQVFENENATSCLVELSVLNQDKSIEFHTSRSVEPLAEPWSTACL